LLDQWKSKLITLSLEIDLPHHQAASSLCVRINAMDRLRHLSLGICITVMQYINPEQHLLPTLARLERFAFFTSTSLTKETRRDLFSHLNPNCTHLWMSDTIG